MKKIILLILTALVTHIAYGANQNGTKCILPLSPKQIEVLNTKKPESHIIFNNTRQPLTVQHGGKTTILNPSESLETLKVTNVTINGRYIEFKIKKNCYAVVTVTNEGPSFSANVYSFEVGAPLKFTVQVPEFLLNAIRKLSDFKPDGSTHQQTDAAAANTSFDKPKSSPKCIVCDQNSKKKCSCGTKYCSIECQTSDWPKHKPNCTAVEKK